MSQKKRQGSEQARWGVCGWFDDLIWFWRAILTAVWQTDSKGSQSRIRKPGRRWWQTTSREMTWTKMVPRGRAIQEMLGRWNWQDWKAKGIKQTSNQWAWWGNGFSSPCSRVKKQVPVTQPEAMRTRVWNHVFVSPEPPPPIFLLFMELLFLRSLPKNRCVGFVHSLHANSSSSGEEKLTLHSLTPRCLLI